LRELARATLEHAGYTTAEARDGAPILAFLSRSGAVPGVVASLFKLPNLAIARRQVVRTPYGDPSSALVFGEVAGREVVFLARHGQGHTIPPHRVNYRANLWALHAEGVREIVADDRDGAAGVAEPDEVRRCRHGRRGGHEVRRHRGGARLDLRPYAGAGSGARSRSRQEKN